MSDDTIQFSNGVDMVPVRANDLGDGTFGLTVGGHKRAAAAAFTRPADTTPYSALDNVGISLVVSGATNASPIVMTTGTHGLVDGDPVTVASVGGNTNANGNYFAKATGYLTTTFALYSDRALTVPVAGNSNYTSGGTVAKCLVFAGMARVAAQNGYVVKGQIFTDQKTCVARFKLHLFNTAVAAILDNSPYPTLWANRAARVGQVVWPAAATEDPTNSDNANAIVTPNASGSNLPLYFGCAVGEDDLFGLLETLDAFTPANAQLFYIRLSVEGD